MQRALRQGKPTVVEFGANACAACREMKPVLEALKREHGDRIGVLTSASPCALAAVPVAVGYVGGQALTARRAWVLALAFVAGMNLALLAMGLLAARLGLLLGLAPEWVNALTPT